MADVTVSNYATQTATIANGATVSSALTAAGFISFGVALPAAFTGVALTFQVSADGTTYQALNNDAGAVSITVAQGKSYALPAGLTAFPYFKIVSGAAEGGARSLVVAMKS
jgi:hypothetical protein